MKKISNKSFENQLVKLDDRYYENCIFKNCIIEYSGSSYIGLENNNFYECRWSFAGPAGQTLAFLRILYTQMGEDGRKIVDATFDKIKN